MVMSITSFLKMSAMKRKKKFSFLGWQYRKIFTKYQNKRWLLPSRWEFYDGWWFYCRGRQHGNYSCENWENVSRCTQRKIMVIEKWGVFWYNNGRIAWIQKKNTGNEQHTHNRVNWEKLQKNEIRLDNNRNL